MVQYIEQLAQALRDPALDGAGPKASSAALNYAIARGACTHFGVDCNELVWGMPARIAIVAAQALAVKINQHTANLATLGLRWDRAIEASEEEAEMLLLGELEFALEVGHAREAIVEAWLANPDARELERALENSNHALMAYWDALKQHKKLFASIAHNPMLENWRQSFAEPFKANLPWWLNGELEKVAVDVRQEAETVL